MTWRSNFSQSMGLFAVVALAQVLHLAVSAQGARVIFVFGERLLKTLQCISHSTLDRVLGHPRHGRDVLERDVRELTQEEHLTLLGGQRLDAAHDPLAELVPYGR